MIIKIEEECDGFVIWVDDKRWRFDQEDDKQDLVKVMQAVCPTAEVSYTEVY